MQLELLWNLQELDLSIYDLQDNIEKAPSESGIAELEEHLDGLKTDYSSREEELKTNRKALKKLELNTQKIIDDRKELKENLYNGTVTNVKELEQMHRKLDILGAEKQKLEDETIMLMELLENQETELTELERELKAREKELAEKESELQKRLNGLQDDLKKIENEREELVAKIDKKMLAKYDELAVKYSRRALARVENDLCGGCQVFISSAQRGHLYNPGAMVYCENCGRLLVRLESSDEK